MINQDCVENNFSQLRGGNEQKGNPTYQIKQGTQNSITLARQLSARKVIQVRQKAILFAGLPKENLFGKKICLQKSPAMGLLIEH